VKPRREPPEPARPEDDPTGVRELLSSLPDPGPMPPELAQRICASIASEQAARTRPSPAQPASGRWWVGAWRPAAVAAAAAVVLAGGGAALLTGIAPRGVSILVQGGGDAGAEGADSGAAEPEAGRALTGPRMGTSGTAYSAGTLAVQARSLLSATPAPMADEGRDSGPVAAPAGVTECAAALGVAAEAVAVVDLGTFDGVPAAVLVVRSGDHHAAYAVHRSCAPGAAGLLAGPVPVR
jgi:hypothetical protein